MKNFISLLVVAIVFGSCTEKLPEKVITDDGVVINYEINGSADTTLLLLHGWAIDKGYWDQQVAAFTPRYKVVTLDHAGHGNSEGRHETWSPGRLGKDVAQAIEQLKLDNVIMVGHSMSGTIMLETQAIVPEKVIGLIGVDNFKEAGLSFTPEQEQGMKDFMAYFAANYSEVARQYTYSSLFNDASPIAAVDRVLASVLAMDSTIAVAIIDELTWSSAREADLLKALPHKLYLLNSSASPTDTLALESLCKSGYKVIDVGPTGHYPMIEDAERFNRCLALAIAGIQSQN